MMLTSIAKAAHTATLRRRSDDAAWRGLGSPLSPDVGGDAGGGADNRERSISWKRALTFGGLKVVGTDPYEGR